MERYFNAMPINRAVVALVGMCAAIVLFAPGCSPNRERVRFQTGYFDLEQFMDAQVVQLWKTNANTAKNVFLNGKTETKTISGLDSLKWRTELGSFFDADINKPAYVKRYKVDTTKLNDSIACVSYTALDEKLRTRSLKLYFTRQQTVPTKIEAELKSDKIFYHSYEQVSYTHGQGYDIAGKQDVVFSKGDTFAVHARFAR